MYLIKIMSAQNLADTDMAKNYKMIAIGAGDQFEFYHCPSTGLPYVCVTPKDGESYRSELTGNAYVISQHGKTVATHWSRSLWGRDFNGGIDPEEIQSDGARTVVKQSVEIGGTQEPIRMGIGEVQTVAFVADPNTFAMSAEIQPKPSA